MGASWMNCAHCSDVCFRNGWCRLADWVLYVNWESSCSLVGFVHILVKYHHHFESKLVGLWSVYNPEYSAACEDQSGGCHNEAGDVAGCRSFLEWRFCVTVFLKLPVFVFSLSVSKYHAKI